MTFSAAASGASAAIFAQFGVPVVYTPPVGAAIACTGVQERSDELRPDASGMTMVRERRLSLHLRAAEVPNPVRGASVLLGGFSYPVEDVMLIDEYHWLLTLAVHEATS